MDIKFDLTFAQVVAEQIDDYVHAETLFYPVGRANGLEMPPLTIGTWLETEWRLSVVAPNDPTLAAARAAVRQVRESAPELYQNKARREFRSRLDTWEFWLDEQNTANAEGKERIYNDSASYTTQVHVRFKLDLLNNAVAQLPPQIARMGVADETLRRHFRPGAFMWAPELRAAAPPDRYWWLYGA